MKFDLATLDLADGTHTIKVKAKADGYYDSEFSNEVNYTKVPTVHTINISTEKVTGDIIQGTSFRYNTPPTSYTDNNGMLDSNGKFSGKYPDGTSFNLRSGASITVSVGKIYFWGYKLEVDGVVHENISFASPLEISNDANIKIFSIRDY